MNKKNQIESIFLLKIVHCAGYKNIPLLQEPKVEMVVERRASTADTRRASTEGRGSRAGSVQPKKLAEMEVVTLEQIRSMSGKKNLFYFLLMSNFVGLFLMLKKCTYSVGGRMIVFLK